jgi:hypothetical protein
VLIINLTRLNLDNKRLGKFCDQCVDYDELLVMNVYASYIFAYDKLFVSVKAKFKF